MLRRNRHSKMWEYLDACGVLEKGSDEEIKAAKKEYRKKYLLVFKQRQRISKPEFTLGFSKEKHEYERVSLAAKKHKMTVTAFLRSAVLAYMNNIYVVPDREQVARFEQLLSECLNEIKTIVRTKERFFWERERKLEVIEKRIEKLEIQVNDIFRNPPLALHHDSQNQIA